MRQIIPIAVLLLTSANAWPGYKSTKPKLREGDDNCIDTGHVHNECGPIRKPTIDRIPGVRYPSAFIM